MTRRYLSALKGWSALLNDRSARRRKARKPLPIPDYLKLSETAGGFVKARIPNLVAKFRAALLSSHSLVGQSLH